MLRAELSPAQSSSNDDRREEAAIWAALFGHNISSRDGPVWRAKSFFPHSCLAPAAAPLGEARRKGRLGGLPGDRQSALYESSESLYLFSCFKPCQITLD